MSANKVSITDLDDFLHTEEGWRLFLVVLNGMAAYREMILMDGAAERDYAMRMFESSAALVDFLNALISTKVSNANE